MLDKSNNGPSLSGDVRMGVWAQYLHGKVSLVHADLLVGDLVPRNVMVCKGRGNQEHREQRQQQSQQQQGQRGRHLSCATCADARYRVVCFDFDRAESRKMASAEKPNNPIWAYWNPPDLPDFEEWLPSWFGDEEQLNRRRQWLIEQFGGAHVGEYAEFD